MWICEDCGHESADEHSPCSCEDDTSELVAEIRRLRAQVAAQPKVDDTLRDAKQMVMAKSEEGVACPCCEQFVKVYKRKLNSSMAYVLLLIARWDRAEKAAGRSPDRWLHVPSFIAQDLPARAAAIRGDWAKLLYWDMIISNDGTRDDGSKRNGFYKISELGRQFAAGVVRVPSHVYVCNKQLLNRPVATTVDIHEALGAKFNYDELMEPAKLASAGIG